MNEFVNGLLTKLGVRLEDACVRLQDYIEKASSSTPLQFETIHFLGLARRVG